MPDFRRYRVPGGCYFFIANLLERRGNILLTDRVDLLREAVRRVRRSRPFTIDASSFPIICTPFGHCRQATTTSRPAGV